MIGERRGEKLCSGSTKEAMFGSKLIIDWTDMDASHDWITPTHVWGYQYASNDPFATGEMQTDTLFFVTWEEAEVWLLETGR